MEYETVRSFVAWFGLVVTIAAFIGIVWWAFRPKHKKRLERHADIPLRDESDRG